MKKIFTAVFICLSLFSKAQTFTWSGYSPITPSYFDTVYIPVSGLPSVIDSTFGISKVCFDVYHGNKSNLILILVAPNNNSAILIEGQGVSNQNFMGTCVGMDGVPFALGIPPYTGTFLPAGDISSFNSGINPNGTWMLLAGDISNPDTGSIRLASITFSNNPPRSNGFGGNNLGPSGPFVRAGLVCPGGASGCDLLPDVTASAYEILTRHTETLGQLTISNGTPNIGYGPLELFGIDSCFCDGMPSPCNVACPNSGELKHVVRQRIYRKIPGTDTLGFYDRDAGRMTYHPEHGHLHVDDWATFTLRTATSDPDPRNWPIVGTSVKQSFCLINLGTCAGKPGECVDNNGNTILTVPNNGFGFYSGCGLNQGIWPGSYDVYSEGLNDPIPLDSICNGNYYIVSITDPENKFLESDETNNVVAVPITLTHQNRGTPVISSQRTAFICGSGDSILLTSSQQQGYHWSTGENTRSIYAKNPGTYTVTSTCNGLTSTPFVVNPLPNGAKPAVSVGITAGSNPSCKGTALAFKATSLYEGSTPAYQWKVNGISVGTNSNTYTTSALSNGQKVSCVLTSSISCFSATPVSSDSITIAINPTDSFTAVVTQTKGYNPFCPGDTVTFTAAAVPGTNPVYHWKVDGVNAGTNSQTFTSLSLQHGQVVSCTINAISLCSNSVGTSAGYNGIQNIAPSAYSTWYGNGRQQYLITADELLAAGITAGPIKSLGFITGGNIGDPDTLKGYTIKLSQVSITGLGTQMYPAAFNTVFGPVDYRPALNTINTHTFTTPYSWNGTSNLLVDICFSNLVVGNGNYQTAFTYTPFVSSCMYEADGTNGADACNATTGNGSASNRPVMIFSNNLPKDVNSNQVTLEHLKPIYHFIGNGNWNIASNWENSIVPPKHVLHCAEIIIDPVVGGECILNTSQIVAPGAKITVITGKKFRVIGNVLVQE